MQRLWASSSSRTAFAHPRYSRAETVHDAGVLRRTLVVEAYVLDRPEGESRPDDAHAERLAALALMATSGLGPIRIRALVEAFGSARAAAAAPSERARQIAGRAFAMRPAAWDSARNVLEACAELAVEVVPWSASGYPPLLRPLEDPPPVLFVRGAIPLAARSDWDEVRAVAVVGTREPSARSRGLATELGRDLAASGIVVVSGLALGIDGAAHQGALSAADGAPPVAVLAGGLDRIHPTVHRGLAERIVAFGGALISEDPPGLRPQPHRFVARNRIVSGLCRAVAIVEAGGRSGALHTADFALEQGRQVFVVPDHPTSTRAFGNVQLLRSGALLLTEASDVTTALEWAAAERENRTPVRGLQRLTELADRAPCTLDGLPGDPVENMVLMAELEIGGFVVRDGLGRYRPTAYGSAAVAGSTAADPPASSGRRHPR